MRFPLHPWVRSAIVGDVRRGTGILNNPVYKGDVLWGRSRWERSARDSSIRRWELAQDTSQVVAYHDERLRIVSDELWQAVWSVQTARTPRGEAISAGKRRMGRGPARWLSSLLVCAECGSNYVQYGRTDYVCSGHYNGATCLNGARFRIADAERTILDAIRYDFTSPAAIERAADCAMACYEREHARSARTVTVRDEALSAIDASEADVRDQYKLGRLPAAVFTAWLGELEKERSALGRTSVPKRLRVTRDDIVRAYREIVAKRLDVLTKRENAATAREGLRRLLANGRIELKPNRERQRFEGIASFDAAQLFSENQIDIKMVAGARFAVFLRSQYGRGFDS